MTTIAPMRVGVLAALALFALAGTAPGAGEGVLDPADLETLAGTRIANTTAAPRKIRAAWRRVGRVLSKGSPAGLADDLRKLAAVDREARKALAADSALAPLLGEAVAAAADSLRGLPEAAETAIDAVAEKGRPGLEKAAIKARAAFLAGRDAGADGIRPGG